MDPREIAAVKAIADSLTNEPARWTFKSVTAGLSKYTRDDGRHVEVYRGIHYRAIYVGDGEGSAELNAAACKPIDAALSTWNEWRRLSVLERLT